MLVEVAQDRVAGGELEPACRIFPASRAGKDPSVVVAGEAPLADATDVVARGLEFAVGEFEDELGCADRVVEVPEHAGVLVLDVGVVRAALEHDFLAVGNTVVVVVKVGPDGA